MQSISLNNGYQIPVLGLGTWLSKPNEVTEAVREAIKIGYRHFDCAFNYQNEDEVGIALEESLKSGVVRREELFIVTKLPMTAMRPDLVRKTFELQLKKLKLSYIDLYLIHAPVALKEGDEKFPRDADGKLLTSDVDYIDTWKEFEKLVDDGLVKSIGISNFNHKQIERILSICRIPPANIQIEAHPYLTNTKLIDFCLSHNISVCCYSPLGSPSNPWLKNDVGELEDPVVKDLATKYGKTPAQILLRFGVDRGVIVIPKSVKADRIKENFDIFDFKLSQEDLVKLLNLNKPEGRLARFVDAKDHPHYPFNEEY